MPLSDAACRAAKSATKPYKISDGGGLHLLVEKNGSRLWRQAYRFDGKQKLIALGAYPAVGLADARAGRDANKALLAKGIDPSAQRKLDRSAARIARSNTFRIVADELITKFEAEGDDPKTMKRKNGFSASSTPIWAIDRSPRSRRQELLDVLRKIERRGRYDTARRARSISGRVFKYAISTNRAERDPSADLTGALIAPKVNHRAAITEPKAVGALLRAIDDMDGQITTRAALQLIALTFVRPGELRHAEWKEFDLRDAVWNIPKEKMKMPRPHKVPLSRQAIAIINDLREVTGTSPYLFPQIRSWHRPISDGTLNAALRRLGYTKAQVTAHGFRSTASTLLNESRRSDGRRRWDSDAIERQLAHQEEDEVRGAYNGAEYWEERVPMMQWYADSRADRPC